MAPTVPPSDPVLHIDCHECALHATSACEDCVVTFLIRSEVATSVVVDLAEARAVRLLAEGGLAPPLRHVRSTG